MLPSPSDWAQAEPPTARRPALIVMVGAPGSGKSYLGRQISALVGATLIQTDVVRKALFREPRYTPAEAARVYDACHARAQLELAAGRHVVFDGTNLRERRRRRLYRLADQCRAALVVVVADAPEDVIRARLARRMAARDPDDVSDADWDVYLKLRGSADPVTVPHVVANTAADLAPVLRLVERLVKSPPGTSATDSG